MFSGIVETQAKIIEKSSAEGGLRIVVERPQYFTDIKIGDSISTNGVCLTVEKLSDSTMQFFLGAETLKIIDQSLSYWFKYSLNLERSLRLGDRVHGHLVTGHVDATAEILESYSLGESWILSVSLSKGLTRFFWKKGSACINGVSLTVNEILENKISFCLIPETLKATNLSSYSVGEFLNIEADYLAKAYISQSGKSL